jgi:hypothetical protein
MREFMSTKDNRGPIAFVPLYLLLIGMTQMISSLAFRIHPRQLGCRRDMGSMAFAAFPIRRLQQRDALPGSGD